MQDEEKPQLRHNYYGIAVIVQFFLKWQYMAETGAGAGAEIRDKGGARAENK